ELTNVVELSAVGQDTASVHRERIMKGEFLAAFGDADGQLAARFRTIAFAPAAHDIKVLQGKAGRVNFGVASAARFQGAMFIQLLTDRNCAANVWFDGGHVRWRWRRLLAQDALHNPSPAQDGRGGSS